MTNITFAAFHAGYSNPANDSSYGMIFNTSNMEKSANYNNISDSFPLMENAIFASVFTLIGVIGLIGNSLVIVAIASDAKMRKSAMNILLLNLAIADLSNLIVCIPDIILNLLQLGWILAPQLCPALRYLEVCFLYTSLLTQVAVCIESFRFIAIAIPMRIRLLCSRKKVALWVCTLWTSSSIFAIPIGIWNKVLKDRKTNYMPLCQWRGNRKLIMIFRCFECLTFYFIPLLLIVILYSAISLILWSKNETLYEGSSRSNKGKMKSNEPLRVRQNVVKMLIACICVYFVCYSPIQVIFIAETFFDRYFKMNLSVRLSFNCLTYACSAGNPLLYSIFSQKFRRKFAQILSCTKAEPNDDDVKIRRQTFRRRRSSNNNCELNLTHTEEIPLTCLNVKHCVNLSNTSSQ